MDFTTLAAARYSVRDFANTPVSKQELDAVLEAGSLAPTACNLQPQRIYILQSDAALSAIRGPAPSTRLLFCSSVATPARAGTTPTAAMTRPRWTPPSRPLT